MKRKDMHIMPMYILTASMIKHIDLNTEANDIAIKSYFKIFFKTLSQMTEESSLIWFLKGKNQCYKQWYTSPLSPYSNNDDNNSKVTSRFKTYGIMGSNTLFFIMSSSKRINEGNQCDSTQNDNACVNSYSDYSYEYNLVISYFNYDNNTNHIVSMNYEIINSNQMTQLSQLGCTQTTVGVNDAPNFNAHFDAIADLSKSTTKINPK